MKKILFLIDSLGSGGAQHQMCTVSCLLKSAGYDVSFLCYHNDAFYKPLLDSYDIPVKVINYKTPVGKIIKIWKAVGESKCDVVISMLSSPNFYALISSFGRRKKVITGVRGVPDLPGGNYGKDAKLACRARYIVSNSENAKTVWLSTYPKHLDKFRVIYNIVKLDGLSTNYVLRRDGRIHICVAASLYSVKNPRGLIDALKLMTDDERSIFCIEWYGLNGSGSDKESSEIIDIVKKSHLESVLIIHNKTSDIANVMYQSDVVGLFSYREGLPNAICEGMMLGKPIIMTKVSDYNILVGNDNGILCDADNPVTIKEAILTICKMEDNEIVDMGQASKAKAEHLFSCESVIGQWIDIIEN